MTQLFFCTVSSVNYENATASVSIPEREDIVKTDIPILDTVFKMPDTGDTVAALFDDVNGHLQRGVIIGRPYHQTNIMEITAKSVNIKQLHADSIIYKDSCEKG